MPDVLFQLPHPSTGPALDDSLTACLVHQLRLHSICFSEVQACTREDPDLQTTCRYVEKGWPHKNKLFQQIMPLFHVRTELESTDGVLLHDGQLVLSKDSSAWHTWVTLGW